MLAITTNVDVERWTQFLPDAATGDGNPRSLPTSLPCVSHFDKMSMAASLDVRVPFADRYVVAFCMGLPDDRRILWGRRKEILRRVSRVLLDDAAIDKKKRGFMRAASSTWLHTHRDGIVREALPDTRARDRGIFVPGAVEDLIAQPQGSGRAGEPLLAVLLVELWHRQFVDADGAGRLLVGEAKRAAT